MTRRRTRVGAGVSRLTNSEPWKAWTFGPVSGDMPASALRESAVAELNEGSERC
jgi:hypothetical protein